MAPVPAYRKSDGKKVYIPEHWLGHPTLGKPFRKSPKTPPRQRVEVIEKAPAASGGDIDTPKEK